MGKRGSDIEDYRAIQLTDEEIDRGDHRRWVGGKWDVMGPRQLRFLVDQGLQTQHRLLDVGCGSLRAGVHFIQYLDSGNYFGLDINASLIRAGWRKEIPRAGLQGRIPRSNLRRAGRFDARPFNTTFDYAIAQSVFSHTPLNHIRMCLWQLAQVMVPGGRFFGTFYLVTEDTPLDDVKYLNNPYHYPFSDIEWAATVAPWNVRYIGDWGHPRNQMMVEFELRGK